MKYHENFTVDDFVGVQKFHKLKTPRVGGVSVFFGLITAIFLINMSGLYSFEIWKVIIFSLIPCFLGGLYEDFLKTHQLNLEYL